jgi:hypothetical protein
MTKLIVSALFAVFMSCAVVEAGQIASGVTKTQAAVPHPF